jgi:hypothetical protein
MIPPCFKVIQKNNNASIELEALHVLLNSKNRTFFLKMETVLRFKTGSEGCLNKLLCQNKGFDCNHTHLPIFEQISS